MLSLQDYLVVMKNILNSGQSIVFGCSCSVKYSGRAESFLPEGDRIVMIKSDNTLLVHQSSGSNPANYMKQGTTHSIASEENSLVLRSKNISSKEFMEIMISRVHFFNYMKMNDGHSVELVGTEKDMADMLMQNPSVIEKGFKAVCKEEQTKYGFADLLCTDKEGNLAVVECKRYSADLSAVTQLRRYVEKIKDSKGISNVRGILAAPKITPNALKMLNDWGFSFAEVRPPRYLEKFDRSQHRLGDF